MIKSDSIRQIEGWKKRNVSKMNIFKKLFNLIGILLISAALTGFITAIY